MQKPIVKFLLWVDPYLLSLIDFMAAHNFANTSVKE